MQIIDKIKEETDNQANLLSKREDESPKVHIDLADTWGTESSKDGDT